MLQKQVDTAKDGRFNIFQFSQRLYRFFTNRKHDKKLVIDVQNIMQTLATTSNMKQKSKKHDAAETADLVNFLKQF